MKAMPSKTSLDSHVCLIRCHTVGWRIGLRPQIQSTASCNWLCGTFPIADTGVGQRMTGILPS